MQLVASVVVGRAMADCSRFRNFAQIASARGHRVNAFDVDPGAEVVGL